MLKCNLAVLLAERNLKITKVSKDTGISRTTLTSLAGNSGQGIQFDTLNSLCTYLNITPSEFFVFAPIDVEVSSERISEREFAVKLSLLNIKGQVSHSATLQVVCTYLRDKMSRSDNQDLKDAFDFLAEDDELFLSMLIKVPTDTDNFNFVMNYIKPLSIVLKSSIESSIACSIMEHYRKAGFTNIGAGIDWEVSLK